MSWYQFDIWMHRSVYRLNVQHTSIYQYIQGILSLRNNHSEIRLSYLNAQKILEFPQVFCLKVAEEVLFKFLNTILVTTCNDNVIHINNQVNTLASRSMMIKNQMVCCTSNHAKLLNHRAKSAKPSSRRLFQTI